MSQDFTYTISTEMLASGLRKSKRSPRNANALVESKGAVGRDGVLAALDSLTRTDTSSLDSEVAFPYPQIFALTNVVLVCTATKIFEFVGGSLVLMLTVSTGQPWTVVDFGPFIYMSNNVVAVIRDAQSLEYSVSSDLPATTAACNFNGQVLVGGKV